MMILGVTPILRSVNLTQVWIKVLTSPHKINFEVHLLPISMAIIIQKMAKNTSETFHHGFFFFGTTAWTTDAGIMPLHGHQVIDAYHRKGL